MIMVQIQIKNEKISGTCKSCGNKSDSIYTPPLIVPPDFGQVTIHGDNALWAPSRMGKIIVDRKYHLTFEDGAQYLRPESCPHDPICITCYLASLVPAEWPLVVNKPSHLVDSVVRSLQ